MALIEMGDFAGAVLKHLRRAPIPGLRWPGGFGKISKLAAGHLDLHSRRSSVDLALLAVEAAALGADASLQGTRCAPPTPASRRWRWPRQRSCRWATGFAHMARALSARAILPPEVAVEVWATDREGQPVGHAGFALSALAGLGISTGEQA